MAQQIKSTMNAGFYYDAINLEHAAKLKLAANKIKKIATASIREIGEILVGVKLAVEHGAFQAWVSAELGFSPRTAERYMAFARFTAEHDNLSLLKPSSVYLLASPSTPPSVQDEVATLLQKKKKVPVAKIRSMIEEAKPSGIVKGLRRAQRRRSRSTGADPAADVTKVRRKPLIRLTRTVRQIVTSGNSPADAKVFWARVRRKDGYFVIVRLTKATPR